MKKLFASIIMLGTLSAQAVELSEATNNQLLEEVSIRLRQAGDRPPVEDKTFYLTGICETDNDLRLRVLNEQGEVVKTYATYLGDSCKEQLDAVNDRLGVGKEVKIFAVCETDRDLITIRASNSGINVSSDFLGNRCPEEARRINDQFRP